MAKRTAENAREIEAQMNAAAAHLGAAIKAVRAAQEAVKKGENEVEFKLPEFANLEGLLAIGFSSAHRTAANWSDNAIARERR